MPNLHNCTSLFIDITYSIYCSYDQEHKVIKIRCNDISQDGIIMFGNGTNGPTPELLSWPSGIFVDSDLRLYVADTGNDRIQLFERENTTGTTVAVNSALGHKHLKSLTGIVVDRNGYLYIVDSGYQRIIRSERDGFRCILGCSEHQLSSFHSHTIWFDTIGNMFAFDRNNHQIQKFSRLTDSSDKFKALSFIKAKICLTVRFH